MPNSKYITLLIGTLLLHSVVIDAQNAKPLNVVTASVPFLRISSDARAGGMGDVGIATPADVNAVFWNLGKLAFTQVKAEIGANYTPWLRDMANDMYTLSLNGTYKLSDDEAVYAGVRYFSLGDMQFEDNKGNRLQSFHPREWSAGGGYSRKISRRSGIGIGLKFIYSNLANKGVDGNSYKAGTAVAADLGYYYNGVNSSGAGWSFGAAFSNLGSKIAYTNNAEQKNYIPANLGLGAAFAKTFDEQNKIIFAADINKLLVPTPSEDITLTGYRNKSVAGSWISSLGDAPGGFSEELKEFQVSIGTEYWYNDQFAFRAGYFYENPAKGNRKSFTVGTGIRYQKLTFNFTYLIPSGNSVNRSPLANTLRFGFIVSKN
jgi:hypothetical protein